MRQFMEEAVTILRESPGLGARVGAILVKDGVVLARSGKVGGMHAERVVIMTALAGGHDLSDATLFTTLEPCVAVGSSIEACADLIARVGIGTVFIGRYDPNPLVHRLGWKRLRDAGIRLKDFDADLRSQIDAANQDFAGSFAAGTGPSGGAKFDYQLNGGRFEIRFSSSDDRTIVTQWKHRGPGSIYAYATGLTKVALARYATDFQEIDDPAALDFTYTVPVDEGEIVVFTTEDGAVLVQVEQVVAGSSRGAAQRFVKLRFEVRASDA